jgi:hypothetical protein
LAHVWAWCTASHPWNRMLPWFSVMGLCVLLAWAMNIAVTGGFVDHEVVLPAFGVPASTATCLIAAGFEDMAVDDPCNDSSLRSGVASRFSITIAFTDFGGAPASMTCDSYRDRVLADVVYVDAHDVVETATELCREMVADNVS